jgi:hypothetical protein
MRKFVDDYEIVIEEDEKGREKKKAVYRGDYYEVNIEKFSLVKFKWYNIVLFLVILGLQIAGGFINNQGMYRFFIALPYVGMFLPLYFIATGVFRLPKENRKFRRDEVELSFNRIKKASTYSLVLFGMSILGEVIFLIFFANNDYQLEYLFLGTQLAGGVAAYILFNIQKFPQINVINESK